MRPWIYDTIITSEELQTFLDMTQEELEPRTMARQSQEEINIPKPFWVYGLGNATNEALGEDTDHDAYRQFWQLWIHDDGGSYDRIDGLIPIFRKLFTNASSPAFGVTSTIWLENSAEFANETYNTLFRYIRFQSIISRGVRVA